MKVIKKILALIILLPFFPILWGLEILDWAAKEWGGSS